MWSLMFSYIYRLINETTNIYNFPGQLDHEKSVSPYLIVAKFIIQKTCQPGKIFYVANGVVPL